MRGHEEHPAQDVALPVCWNPRWYESKHPVNAMLSSQLMPRKCTDADGSRSCFVFLSFYMEMHISGKPVESVESFCTVTNNAHSLCLLVLLSFKALLL